MNKRNAFIFTTDAFLALPLIVIAISTFVAFSVNLRDNITSQEYGYIIAKDAMNVLIDSSPYHAGKIGNDSFAYIIAKYIFDSDLYSANQTASVLDDFIPSNAAYILEFKSPSGNRWVEIRRVDKFNKIKENRFSVQVSNVRLVTGISNPERVLSNNCPADIVCRSPPFAQYREGKQVGPLLLRIRVFI
ncbi:MAG: hypothetical protein N3D72_02225 [Candidatus Methanomethyliaceae archaeon]|nr:hypothetical protein [Candidatus Methanomethyliaceae archaeon]